MNIILLLLLLLVHSSSLANSANQTRKKRTITLPNQTSLLAQSQLTIPRPPYGSYTIWLRFAFFVRPMFNDPVGDATTVSAQIFGRKKRFADEDAKMNQLAENQASIFKKLETYLDQGGLDGKQCLLKTVCELRETPIGEWSMIGEMISHIFRPRFEQHPELKEYTKAAHHGERDKEECWSIYSNCSISIFNFIPDIFTEEGE